MRWTQSLIPTLRQAPKDAEATSHKLMLRAGLIRQLSSGVYSYLPLGWRVLRKIAAIVRDEMEESGAVDLFLPGLHPAELWKQTGRYDSLGDDKFAFRNRAQQEYVLGPTHEEVITALVGDTVSSYKQLPITVFQIQTKFRDEARPRFGVIRSKEFIMKDAYSFDADEAGMDKSYQTMYDAYHRIFRRTGLHYEAVQADPGLMGGNFSHEFMLPADFGEDIIAECNQCDYRASLDIAAYKVPEAALKPRIGDHHVPPIEVFNTPGLKTIDEITGQFNVKANQIIKALVYIVDEKPIMVLVRGDHDVNEAKVRRCVGGTSIRLATADEILQATGCPPGFVGPVGIKNVPIYADAIVMVMSEAVTGALAEDRHIRHAVPGRDFMPQQTADLRYVEKKDVCSACGKGKLKLTRAMEIGHVFKLGTRYSKPLSAFFLNAEGKQVPFLMGCYGIGINRILAGAIEQHHDERGICWPESIAPFAVEIVTVNESHEETKAAARKLYDELQEKGIDVLYDDRDERAGVKFNDADLIGIPFQVIMGERNISSQKVDIKVRKNGKTYICELSRAIDELSKIILEGKYRPDGM